MKWHLPLVVLLFAGCATTIDPNYLAQLEAYRSTVTAQRQIELERVKTEAARYDAIAILASEGDPTLRGMALIALALSGRGGGAEMSNVNLNVPQAPERQEDRAFKWAALFAAPVATLVQGYFTYRLGVNQSNNSTNASIASYNALGGVATAGFGANQGIATAGFNASQGIAAAGFGALSGMRPPAPNITFNGTGVLAGGNGTYTGPNSGSNSGNSGRISSPDNNQRNCAGLDALNLPAATPSTVPC